MSWSQIQRDLYLSQRAIGDGRAASRGPKPYARRIARRQVQRRVVGPAMTALFRGLFR